MENNKSFAILAIIGFSIIGAILLIPSQATDTIFFIQKDGSTPEPCSGNVGLVLAQNLTDLCDVTITNPLTNQTVFYNGSQWINVFFGSNSTGCTDLDCLTDVTIINVDNNNILQYNETSTQWENRGILYNTTISMDGQSIFFNTSLDDYEFLVDGTVMTLRQNENRAGAFYIFGGNSGTEQIEFALFGDGNTFDIMSTVSGFEIFINANQYTFPNNSGQLLTDVNVVDGIGIDVVQSGDDVIINTKFANGTGISITGTDTLTFTNTGVISVTSNNNNTIGVVPTAGNVVLYPKIVKLCETIANGGETSLSCSLSETPQYFKIGVYHNSSVTNTIWEIRFNADSGNNYSTRSSTNGAADSTVTNTDSISSVTITANQGYYYTWDCNNPSSNKEKHCFGIRQTSANGSGNADSRVEFASKWTNLTSNITSVDLVRTASTGTLTAGSYIIVYGVS